MSIRIAQSDFDGVLTSGTIPGPFVCGGLSQGTIGSNRIFPASGATVYSNYFFNGCDLIMTEAWGLTLAANGQVLGSWSVGARDQPADCAGSGGFFPCTNTYDVAGASCVGCFAACPVLASGSSQRTGSTWSKR